MYRVLALYQLGHIHTPDDRIHPMPPSLATPISVFDIWVFLCILLPFGKVDDGGKMAKELTKCSWPRKAFSGSKVLELVRRQDRTVLSRAAEKIRSLERAPRALTYMDHS